MRTDIYTELYLWNKNIDSLIRVLQRLELLGICSKRLKTHEMRFEELRAGFNSDLLEAMLAQEQNAEARFQQLVCECAVGMLRKPTKCALFTLFAFVA
jgi:hypothetical protein